MTLRDILLSQGASFIGTHQDEYVKRLEQRAEWDSLTVGASDPFAEALRAANRVATDLLRRLAAHVAKHPELITWSLEMGDPAKQLMCKVPSFLLPKTDLAMHAWRQLITMQGLSYLSDSNEITWIN
jgi:hypothetical protein